MFAVFVYLQMLGLYVGFEEKRESAEAMISDKSEIAKDSRLGNGLSIEFKSLWRRGS